MEQATDGLFKQGVQPRAFLLMHDLPQASLDEIGRHPTLFTHSILNNFRSYRHTLSAFFGIYPV